MERRDFIRQVFLISCGLAVLPQTLLSNTPEPERRQTICRCSRPVLCGDKAGGCSGWSLSRERALADLRL